MYSMESLKSKLCFSPGVNVQTDAGLARVVCQAAGLPPHVPHLDHTISTPREQTVALVKSGMGKNRFQSKFIRARELERDRA